MHGGPAAQPLDGAFQRGDAPVIDLVEEDIEGRFVELDDVDARRLQLARLLIEDAGEFPGQLFAAPVMGVVERVDHGHRPRQRPFDRLRRVGAQEFGILDEDRFAPRHRPRHAWHAGVVPVADAHGFALCEIDPVQVLDKGGDEVLARLFAVADDVDTGLLLVGQGQAQRVLFALDQGVVLQFPRRPQGLGLRQPCGFGQAAGGGGGQKLCHDEVLGV